MKSKCENVNGLFASLQNTFVFATDIKNDVLDNALLSHMLLFRQLQPVISIGYYLVLVLVLYIDLYTYFLPVCTGTLVPVPVGYR